MCDLGISKMHPNAKGRHSTQHQIKQNVIGLSTFTGARKIIYIRISFVRLHVAILVLSVISKEQ
jgi:cell division protein FtsL